MVLRERTNEMEERKKLLQKPRDKRIVQVKFFGYYVSIKKIKQT